MRCEKTLPATSLLLGCEVGQDKVEQDMGHWASLDLTTAVPLLQEPDS